MPIIQSIGAFAVMAVICIAPNACLAQAPHAVAADTGRMAWGRMNYRPYRSPALCDRAAAGLEFEVLRTNYKATQGYTLAGDTLPTEARISAQTCAQYLDTANIDRTQLFSLLRLALAKNDDATARKTVERQLSLTKNIAERAILLQKGIETYLQGRPPRLPDAQLLLRRLETIGGTAEGASNEKVQDALFKGHVAFLTYWRVIDQHDSLRMRANAAIMVSRRMKPAARSEADVILPYYVLLDLENSRGDIPAQRAVIEQGITDASDWRSGRGAEIFYQWQHLVDTRASMYGKRVRPLNGAYWFNRKDTEHPKLGTVSLFAYVPPNCGGGCYPVYTLLRALGARYGQKLDLTLITGTAGHMPALGLLDPAEEARRRAAYFLDFWKLPVALVVDKTPYTRLEDGRIQYQQTALTGMLEEWSLANMVIVGSDGTVRWIGTATSVGDEQSLVSILDHVMSRSAL